MRITPTSVTEHGTLETDVTAALKALDFFVTMAVYHEVMSPAVKRRLQRITEPTALYIRHRADRIAVHKTKDLVFEWEAKTHVSQRRHDMTIEVLPLIHHMAKSRLGVRCLYVYRNTYRGHDAGFWVHDLGSIPIRCVMIPARWRESWFSEWITEMCREWLPTVGVVETPHNDGSGDPFVIIDEKVVSKMQPWRTLIREISPQHGESP